MTPETKKEPDPQPIPKESWLSYVVVCLTLIFVLGLLFAPLATDRGTPAREVRARSLAAQLETACFAYLTEYGTLPPTSENYRLIKILSEDNPRKIVFLNLRPIDLSPNGELLDPWGTPYRITFDSNSKVHMVSAGPDKVFGTPDDVTNP